MGVTYDFATESTRTSDKTNELALDGSGTFIGVPFYFSSSPKGYFLMAETGQIRHRRLKEVLDPNVTSIDPEFIELKAHRTGARIGYVDLSQRYEWWLATHVYEWPGVGTVQATSIGFTLTWSDGG